MGGFGAINGFFERLRMGPRRRRRRGGGYAVTRDTIQGEYDAKFVDAWRAAQSVCGTLGLVDSRDASAGVLEATIERAKVRVEVTQITPEAIRLKVKARRGIFPRLGTAQTVFVKIGQQLM
jgi:hypothetical protein